MVQLQKLTKEMINSKNTGQINILVYSIKEFSFGHLSILKKENTRMIFMEIIDSQQFIDFNDFNNQALWIMQKQNAASIISSINRVSFIRSFISKFITSNESQCKMSKDSIEKFLYRNASITIERILGDIDFLEHKFILTSRLAIFIYKICTFDYNASDKEIGLYFSKYYGRSKPFSNKKYGVTNARGYAVKSNILLHIRLDIARKLEQSGVSKDIISTATGINL